MKRAHRLTAGVLCILLAVLLAVPASAHGCHSRSRGHHRRYVQVSVSVCPLESCSTAGRHSHNGVTYCGYAHGSGFCDNSCRALCTREDCSTAGRHIHDGVTYCGDAHESGFCDGSCMVPVSYGHGHRHGC